MELPSSSIHTSKGIELNSNCIRSMTSEQSYSRLGDARLQGQHNHIIQETLLFTNILGSYDMKDVTKNKA